MEELVRRTACEIVGLLQRGEVSPLELINVAQRRIEAVEPALNAVPTLCLERARDRARAFDRQAAGGAAGRFLHGLPVLIKDNTAVAGVRTTYGSLVHAANIPAQSDLVVQRLEAGGAIVMGKTNTPEFAAGGNTYNAVFGTTRNPWDLRTTPGGSSGGAAAALAAGEAWLASGNDFAGSVRLPASFCSIVGLRPTPGRIARGPTRQPYSPLSVEGCMARTVEDVALALDVEAGDHLLDPLSLPRPEAGYRASLDRAFAPARVAFSPDLGLVPVDPEVRAICAAAALRLQDAGCSLDEAHPDLAVADWIFETLRAFIYVERVGPLLAAHRAQLGAHVVENTERGLALGIEELMRAHVAHGELYRRAVAFFADFDVLICPTAITPPFDATMTHLDALQGRSFATYVGWMALTSAVTLMGCPALSLPCGFTSAGLPVGLQIIGPPRQELRVLAIARRLEALLALPRTPIEPRPVALPVAGGAPSFNPDLSQRSVG
ncbi:amidase [Bradyrhizobium sp. U87765 SZCCT0131]|uniref:amidase n=1 Tax=unclassified Bradyrhizobium TaxID=2631580 RepID=UPI001BA6382E|nr:MULTISPECIES: amidase family protein [unclassified Bradyrhizobium]MBR1218818.1 amidase [Bradyrhizobium sp. U87765 SZCCT0131]MBR1261469.1 amidase [Bradyrhizobium sp. U87765 SZCCT0134]MBR1306678.1 amidase [Bradyrhizobium sp. U87765 SZCCT0110]MBR1317251.1 amidase [Bradyrhizobium sp. U87765 SZCCT0109]MBR1350953.1 amidase [Bradyrhizobium sp. U87765 SZCCT0048]